MHATQRWLSAQMGVEVPAQSALELHCTHVDVAASQWEVGGAHCASVVQPGRQRNVPESHTGAAVPQSALERHATQVPRPTRQRGAFAGQSLFTRHSMHCCVVASQIVPLPCALGPVQSVAVMQPTHAPVAVSQIGARPPHEPLFVHGGWQV